MIKLTTFLQTYLLYLLSFVLGQHGVPASWYTVKFRLMDPSVSLTSRHFLCLELLTVLRFGSAQADVSPDDWMFQSPSVAVTQKW